MSIWRATRPTHSGSTVRPDGAGADIVEDQLVRAFLGIATRQLLDAADIFMVLEFHALHDAAIAHIKAGNNAAR
jgi:hypothetical protein